MYPRVIPVFKKVVLFLLLFNCLISSEAQSFKDLFISGEDGAVDMSGFLNSNTGFLPVPIFITEPAVGIGGGLALTYFHKDKSKNADEHRGLSPTVSFAAGAYTTNGTWFVGGGHQGSYLNDRIRYLGVLAYTSVNLTYYGNTDNILSGKYKFNLKGLFTIQELLYRIKKELPLFTGLNYLYFNNSIRFETGIEIPGLEILERETNTAGMNAVIMYDNRNTSLTPTNGLKTVLEIGAFSEALGGDNNFGNLDFRNYIYVPVSNRVFSGYRLQLSSKWGDVPFYQLPFISIRGIPALRYQNDNVYTLETEWRWNVVKRWSLVGFIGAGEALEDYGNIFQDVRVSGGTGFRYFLAKQYGLHAGVDVARGPEMWTWNITVGSNWAR